MADGGFDNPLETEILAEKAAAYFGRVRKMQAALAALDRFDKTSGSGPDHANGEARAELLAEAAEEVWFFLIQREAMKLPHYDELFTDFNISVEVRKRAGPRDPCGPARRTTQSKKEAEA